MRRAPPPNLVWALRRSEEHTSELQSQSNLVCRLLLEKKKILSPPRHNCRYSLQLGVVNYRTVKYYVLRALYRQTLASQICSDYVSACVILLDDGRIAY